MKMLLKLKQFFCKHEHTHIISYYSKDKWTGTNDPESPFDQHNLAMSGGRYEIYTINKCNRCKATFEKYKFTSDRKY